MANHHISLDAGRGRDARGGWQEGPTDPRVRFPPSTVLDEDDERGLFEAMSESFRRTKTESLGHVTSLAVLPDYRRRGLAAQLMEQLHFHMRDGHRAETRVLCIDRPDPEHAMRAEHGAELPIVWLAQVAV